MKVGSWLAKRLGAGMILFWTRRQRSATNSESDSLASSPLPRNCPALSIPPWPMIPVVLILSLSLGKGSRAPLQYYLHRVRSGVVMECLFL
jgi:hypothetical protein